VTLVYCGQTVRYIKMKLGIQVGHCVRWRPSSSPPKGGGAHQFSVHICCGQMARLIKMSPGRKVGLSPSDIVLDGDPAFLPQMGAERPIFGPYLLCPNGWMDQDATWRGSRSRPRPHCARWGPSYPPQMGTVPQFSAHICCGQMAG